MNVRRGYQVNSNDHRWFISKNTGGPSSIEYTIVINSHWEPSLPNVPGKDKIWEEASPEAKKSGSYNPGQNYLRKFSPSCPLCYATKLFPKR